MYVWLCSCFVLTSLHSAEGKCLQVHMHCRSRKSPVQRKSGIKLEQHSYRNCQYYFTWIVLIEACVFTSHSQFSIITLWNLRKFNSTFNLLFKMGITYQRLFVMIFIYLLSLNIIDQHSCAHWTSEKQHRDFTTELK